MNEEVWNEVNVIGEIRIYPLNEKYVDNFDDYDERMRGESQWKDLE